MKKFITLFLCVVLSLSFTACGDSDSNSTDTNTNNSQQVTDYNQQTENEVESSQQESQNIQTESKTDRTEYVKIYSVYAEQGAVVTWFDSKTGQFKYKAKCETCGEIAGGEHGGGLFVGEGTSYNAGFTCTNSNCSMWGKSQRAIIGCSVSGE